MNWIRACYCLWIFVAAVWLAKAFSTKRTTRREGLAQGFGYRLLVLSAGFLLFNSRLSVGILGVRLLSWGAAGFVLTAMGIAFAIWARFFLGRNWSAVVTVKEDHQLIRSGPYGIVRHPIYSGFTLAALGTALAMGEVRGFVAVVLTAIAWRMKWGLEEKYMSEEFGEQYAKYKREVRALIPGLW